MKIVFKLAINNYSDEKDKDGYLLRMYRKGDTEDDLLNEFKVKEDINTREIFIENNLLAELSKYGIDTEVMKCPTKEGKKVNSIAYLWDRIRDVIDDDYVFMRDVTEAEVITVEGDVGAKKVLTREQIEKMVAKYLFSDTDIKLSGSDIVKNVYRTDFIKAAKDLIVINFIKDNTLLSDSEKEFLKKVIKTHSEKGVMPDIVFLGEQNKEEVHSLMPAEKGDPMAPAYNDANSIYIYKN